MCKANFWRMFMLVGALFMGSTALARKPCHEPRQVRTCEPAPTYTTYYYRPRTVIVDYEPTYYRTTTWTYERTITISTRTTFSSTSYYSGRSLFFE